MKKNKLLMLCALMVASTLAFAACGNNDNRDDNGTNSTDAPYEDETDNKVNDTNGSSMGNDLKDAGRNLMDSVKDTGDAIRDGIDSLGDTNREGNTGNDNTGNAANP